MVKRGDERKYSYNKERVNRDDELDVDLEGEGIREMLVIFGG